MKKIKGLLLFLILLASTLSKAQDTLTVVTDTLIDKIPPPKQRVLIEPRNAALRSALLPGWGQYSNRSYWKVPIAAGGVGLGIFSIIRFSNDHDTYRTALDFRFDKDSLTVDQFTGQFSNEELYFETKQRKDYVNLSILYTLYAYYINIMDAYTEASLNKLPEGGHYPVKAAFYSSLFPGLGQIYNKKYWKLPIVYGALGTSIYFIVDNSRLLKEIEASYRTRKDDVPGSYETDITRLLPEDRTEDLLVFKEEVRRNRDISYMVTAAIYLLNILDAVVDAHLYNFNIDDDLSWNIKPATNIAGMPALGAPIFSLKYKF